MLLLYFLLWTAVAANKDPLYKKIGDEAILTPDSVVNLITSIEWKHGPDLAMEWYGGETTAYRHFRDRGSLNTSTGALTITGLTPDDSGSYTVEINNKVTSKTQLLVISPVSKPTVSIRCEREMIYCVLTCNGDTTGAEPVTYRWTSDVTTWSSTKEQKITKEDNELWFSCAFENPVSFNSSEKVRNPFNKEPLYRKIGDKAVLTPDSVVTPIKSIAWTHGPSIAIEWFQNGDETFAYRQFKDRGRLNTLTGELTITGLTPDDSGNYTVEINNKFTSKTQLLVISPVSKPTVSVWCVMIYCVLTCNGDTTGAEPVTYWWTSGNTTLSSTKEHKITKKDKEPWFSCTFKNPISSNISEKVPNPFIKWVLIWTFIFISVFILVVFIIILIYKRRKREDAVRKWQAFLENWDTEIKEMLDTGEDAVRNWQDFLQRLDKAFQERRDKDFLERLNKGAQMEKKEYLEKKRKGEAERKWQEFLQRWDKEFQEMLEEVNSKISEINKTSTQDLETAESPDTNTETGAAERKWQEMLKRLREAFNERRDKGEAAERTWQEFQERRDEGDAAVRKLKGEAAERRWQEFLKKWDEEMLEWLKEVNSKISEVHKTSTQDLETAESPDTSNETGEAAERKWKEMLNRLREAFNERRDKGAAERARQEFQERRDEGEAAVRKLKGEAAERIWQEFLKKWDTEFLEMLEEVNSKISEINKTSTQDLKTAESPDTSNETDEAAERKWQEMLKRLREAFLERLAKGDASERRRQEYLRKKREGEAAERRWQEYLRKKREGADERARQAFQERWDKVKSKISEVHKTSTQDLETAESPDTNNETERPASLVVVQETSPQDTTSTGPPETSNETEMSMLLPPVENPSTQDPTSVVTQDPSNETEESPMIPDNAETRC